MKIEPAGIAGAAFIDINVTPETQQTDRTPGDIDPEAIMSYEALLPYLLLPMAGAY